MTDLLRMRKMTVRVNERGSPFVVEIAVLDGGLECTLAAVNAWHHYNAGSRGRRQHDLTGAQRFWGWCFDSIEIANAARQRFGGEIVPTALRSGTDRGPGKVGRARPISG
jgi:hypothetical protein